MNEHCWLDFPAHKPVERGRYLVTNRRCQGSFECYFVSLAFYNPALSKWYRYEPYAPVILGEEVTNTVVSYVIPEVAIHLPKHVSLDVTDYLTDVVL